MVDVIFRVRNGHGTNTSKKMQFQNETAMMEYIKEYNKVNTYAKITDFDISLGSRIDIDYRVVNKYATYEIEFENINGRSEKTTIPFVPVALYSRDWFSNILQNIIGFKKILNVKVKKVV